MATLNVMANEHRFDEDTERAIKLPKPVPEVTEDDQKNADGGFDDLEIEVDEDEVSAEEPANHPARKT
jgi:hypothetical protein